MTGSAARAALTRAGLVVATVLLLAVGLPVILALLPGGAPEERFQTPSIDAPASYTNLVTLQRASRDCGVAVVSTLLKARGRAVPYDELRQRAAPGIRGLSLRQMIDLAAAFDLPLQAVRASGDAYRTWRAPWVAHLKDDHYVVVLAVESSRLLAADPRVGLRYVDAARFEREWSGVAILP